LNPITTFLKSKCTSYEFQSPLLEFEKKEGEDCAICTVLVQLIYNYADYHVRDISEFLAEDFCKLFPAKLGPTCDKIVDILGWAIIEGFMAKETSDKVCVKVKICANDDCKFKQET